jgi:SAM-dependent methyltransferase
MMRRSGCHRVVAERPGSPREQKALAFVVDALETACGIIGGDVMVQVTNTRRGADVARPSSLSNDEGILVGRDIINDTPDIWGAHYSTDSATVQRDYDTFAESGAYDETFDEWGYVGPETAAAILKNYVDTGSRVLDAACGSGLTGTAMRNLGYLRVDGIDISPRLLEIAERTGAYSRVLRVDMQQYPFPFEDGEYDAVMFIGALTYFETNDVLRELCRVVHPGGHVVFSQRDDIMRERRYDQQLLALEQEGLWRRVFGTEPMPYLPRHPEYGTAIKVQYFVYQVV